LISSPEGEFGIDRCAKQLEACIAETGIERFYLLDSEGNSIVGNEDCRLGSQVLTAMFATIFAAAETSLYEMGVEEEVVVNLESQNHGNVLIFRADADVIVVLETKQKTKPVQELIEKLRKISCQGADELEDIL